MKTILIAAALIGLFLLTACSSNSSVGPGVYPKAVGAADEGSAIQALRTISTAQTQFKATRGVFGSFEDLTQAGMLDQRFAGSAPNLRGYRFTMTANDNEYSVSADPERTENSPTSGIRHFYLDSSENLIHANKEQAASRSDPAL